MKNFRNRGHQVNPRYKVQGPGQGEETSRNQAIAYKCTVAKKGGQYSNYSHYSDKKKPPETDYLSGTA
jgi:hypothetical protein